MSDEKSIDPRSFRQTMGLFGTGVMVLTTGDNGDWAGMTANAVTSVSIDPLLVLVCVAKKANIAEKLLANEGFALNILSAEQQAISNHFAGMTKEDESPPHFEVSDWIGGVRLAGSLGGFGCVKHEVIEGGDHWMVLGQVVELYQDEESGDPLLFYAGKYHTVTTLD